MVLHVAGSHPRLRHRSVHRGGAGGAGPPRARLHALERPPLPGARALETPVIAAPGPWSRARPKAHAATVELPRELREEPSGWAAARPWRGAGRECPAIPCCLLRIGLE